MKRILAICVVVLILPLICIADTGYKNINVWYGAMVLLNNKLFIPTDSNGKTVQPFIYEGTTYMPMRAIIEALGANIEWDPDKKIVIITENENETIDYYEEEMVVPETEAVMGYDEEEITAFVKKEIIAENSNEITNKIIGLEYKFKEYDEWQYFIIIKNTSDYNLDITTYANFYNESGKLVGVNSSNISTLEKGYETMVNFYQDKDCLYAKYNFEIYKSNYTKPVQSILSYKVSELSDKVILSVTNNGEENLDFVCADILFFKGDKIVGNDFTYFTDRDYELKTGKTLHKELYCYGSYDSYLVFLNAE